MSLIYYIIFCFYPIIDYRRYLFRKEEKYALQLKYGFGMVFRFLHNSMSHIEWNDYMYALIGNVRDTIMIRARPRQDPITGAMLT